MDSYTEVQIRDAIVAVTSGQSIKSAAFEYGIPRSILYGQLAGIQSYRLGAEHL